MLQDLIVHNFAIIRHLEISFQEGLNILSGETGAGKSILVGAVNLILGSRASQEMIRTGADEATVEAVFPIGKENGAIGEKLKEWGLGSSDELLIRRSISRGGRNRIFINGQLATLQQLQQLSRGLISVSGQHEHQLLLDPALHLAFLDAAGSLEPLCEEVRSSYEAWSNVREQLNKLRRAAREQSDRLDYLRFQMQELEAAKLQPDEDRNLEQERNILRHAATLAEAAQSAYKTLYTGRGAILEQISDVEKCVKTLRQIDPSQEFLQAHIDEARIHIEELSHSLQQYAHRIAFDPQRLAVVEERLALLQRLGKKYGGSVENMLKLLDDIREQLSLHEDFDLREEELLKALEGRREEYLEKARELSRKRHEVSLKLARDVEGTLAALDMKNARFAVSFEAWEDNGAFAPAQYTPTGIDRVEFLLSANPGENLKPLARIASGGELSRILLALKSLLSRKGEAETLVFDEVDTGIGGRTAELVGLQLKRLAQQYQVICITHLPQIACYGNHHYKVLKESSGEETFTDICMLSSKERVEELSRMMGGISISEKTRAHAQELLQRAQDA